MADSEDAPAELLGTPEPTDSPEEINLELIAEDSCTAALRQRALEEVGICKATGFRVSILERHVHGLYEGAGSDPASLLLYEVHVRSDSKNIRQRVRWLRIQLRFEANPLKLPMYDPCIVSWEPAMYGPVHIHPSEVKYSEEKETKSSAAVKKDPVPVEGGRVWRKKHGRVYEEFVIDDKAKCSSNAYRAERRGGPRKGLNAVEWTLREYESQELLPDSFGAAVVLTRTGGLDFRVVYEVYVYVDFWDDVDEVKDVLNFRGWRELDKTYDVSKGGKLPEGVAKDRLKDLVGKDRLVDFTFIHVPDDIQLTKFYEKEKEEGLRTGGCDVL